MKDKIKKYRIALGASHSLTKDLPKTTDFRAMADHLHAQHNCTVTITNEWTGKVMAQSI